MKNTSRRDLLATAASTAVAAAITNASPANAQAGPIDLSRAGDDDSDRR
jgi:hypothetical protein